MKYYVYTHKLNGEIFYVGKGSGSRARRFTFRSDIWNEFVSDNADLIEVNIVKWFDDEMDAYKFETKLTAHYKSIGQAQANKSVGTKLTEKARRTISKKIKGENNGMYGKRGANNHFSKPIVAIFPDGRRMKAGSQKDMTAILQREYHMTERMIKHIIETGQPFNPRFKQHKELKGLILKYSG